MKEKLFADQIKKHQMEDPARRIPLDMFENQRPWVLKKAHEVENLYKKERWWRYIKGKEHRWARSLKSSQ
jgi:hypothetical protein